MADNQTARIPTGLPGGFFIYHADGEEQIVFAEDNVIRLFGCETFDEFLAYVGNSFRGMVHPDDLDRIENDINAQTLMSEKRHDYVRYRIIAKDGAVRYIEDFGHLLHGEDGHQYFYVYIVDVDKDEFYNRSRNSYAESQILAMNMATDRLTGLFNMATFYKKAQDIISDEERRSRSYITFVHFDIASFKVFNDNFGFQRGDDLLCRVAYTIKNMFPGSIAGRFSNDHFVVCTDAENVAEIVTEVHALVLNIVEGTHVEIRAGIYQLEESCKEVGIACDHARLACNAAKLRYDMIYNIYDAKDYEKIRKQQYIVDHLDEAIEKEYIKVFYQPVIRVKTGKICGYEALARWQDPEYGMLSPADFIDTLENLHLIHKIDSFVIKKVCEDYAILLDAGEDLVPVSVNLSRLDFELCNILEIIEGYRNRYGMPREMLDIEITESALQEKSIDLMAECKKIKDTGYQIWIDDFGSGYSSLNTLTKFDFDVLKLDMEFLRSFDSNPRTGVLLGYIVTIAKEMGVSPLTEGVETDTHFQFLKKIECDKAQGYYFSKPLPMEESRALTRNKGLVWEK